MLILGSQSPRRKEILEQMGLDFKIIPSQFDEIIDQNLSPSQIVLDLAYGKGRDLISKHSSDVIIAADTIVYFEDKKLGKAKSRTEAKELLFSLFDKECEIYTGNAIFSNSKIIMEVTKCSVAFSSISEAELEIYLDAPDADWQDKAGSFAVQGKAKSFTKLTGEYSTCLGLSESFLHKHLDKFWN